MQSNHAKAKELERIVGEAVELPPADRAAFVRHACAGDESLRQEVCSLLSAYEQGGDFLAAPSAIPIPADSTIGTPLPVVEGPGTMIGRYKLLQRIGEGGFGVVFMAEQREPIRRRVALKIIKLGMDTRQVIARFEAERQALALMDHPNIARVLDGGSTETGRPYFVMELVKGLPLAQYADSEKLTVHQRLDMFIDVCNAVQHAHQKGIIHRDLKPSNVIACTRDGRPHVKVIDFGIAKALDRALTEKTLFTEHRQLIGTPQYMSPEQAEGSLDVDTRSDVYSLGVLLYELLAGQPPFDPARLRSAGLAEMVRIIREEEPPRPSLLLRDGRGAAPQPALTSDLHTRSAGTAPQVPCVVAAPEPDASNELVITAWGESAAQPRSTVPVLRTPLADLAARRGTDVRSLSLGIRGDLDWIVLKALEKDRARRYATANDLAADLRRHLTGEPVLAAPPRTSYRLRKFVKRHRVLVLSAASVAVALIAGVVGTSMGWSWALQEREVAREAEAWAFRTTTVLANPLSTDDDLSRHQQAWRERLDQLTPHQGENDPQLLRERALSAVWWWYSRSNAARRQDKLLAVAQEHSPELESFVERLQPVLDPSDPLWSALLNAWTQSLIFGKADPDRVTKGYRMLIEAFQASRGPSDNLAAQMSLELAAHLQRSGKEADAMTTLQEYLAMRDAGKIEADQALDLRHESFLSSFASHAMPCNETFARFMRVYYDDACKVYGPETSARFLGAYKYMNWLMLCGDDQPAAELVEPVLDYVRVSKKLSPTFVPQVRIQCGVALVLGGRPASAERLLGETLEQAKVVYGPNHIYTNGAKIWLGASLVAQNRLEEGQPLVDEAFAAVDQTPRDALPAQLDRMSNKSNLARDLAKVYEKAGYEAAAKQWRAKAEENVEEKLKTTWKSMRKWMGSFNSGKPSATPTPRTEATK